MQSTTTAGGLSARGSLVTRLCPVPTARPRCRHGVPADVPGDNSLNGLNIVPFDTATLVEDGKAWDDRYDAQLRGVQQVSN
jgi:hypothetical protein